MVPQFNDYQFKIYIDTNHNGYIWKPYNYTYRNDFEFNDLNPGVYFFKLNIPDDVCRYSILVLDNIL